MITDDLDITPVFTISAISFLDDMNVPINEIIWQISPYPSVSGIFSATSVNIVLLDIHLFKNICVRWTMISNIYGSLAYLTLQVLESCQGIIPLWPRIIIGNKVYQCFVER